MAILDFGASEAGGWWDIVPTSERPDLPDYVRRKAAVPRRAARVVQWDTDVGARSSPDLVGWALRIATVITLLVATIIGLEIAMDAPTISPVAAVGQGPPPDAQN